MIGLIFSLIGLAWVISKGAFQALLVVYPSYKTYKAIESRSLRLSQAMLLYWCVTAFANSLKEFADELFGAYSNFFLWKMVILTLKAAPLIIGPERLYDAIVKPFYEKHEGKIDAVVDEAHKLKSLAQEAVPAVKEGNVDAAKGKAAELVDAVKLDAADIVHTIQQQAIELTDKLQEKSAQFGVEWDRQGLAGLLDRSMSQWERLRDSVMSFASVEWQKHGPFVKKQVAFATDKTKQYAPVVKQKAVGVWNTKITPRIQLIVAKYDTRLKPFVLGKVQRVNDLWVQKGGPVRSFYLNKARPFFLGTVKPFVMEKLLPFLIYSVWPAVHETAIVLKDKISDLASTPSDEVKAGRVHHKRRRADARRERRQQGLNPWAAEWKEGEFQRSSIFKRQKTDIDSDVTESKQPQLDETSTGDADVSSSSSASSTHTSPETIVPGGATLKNRKTNETIDSTAEAPIRPTKVEEPVEPPAKGDWESGSNPIIESLKQDLPNKEEGGVSDTTTNKHRSTGSGEKEKDSAWSGESRDRTSIAAE